MKSCKEMHYRMFRVQDIQYCGIYYLGVLFILLFNDIYNFCNLFLRYFGNIFMRILLVDAYK